MRCGSNVPSIQNYIEFCYLKFCGSGDGKEVGQ